MPSHDLELIMVIDDDDAIRGMLSEMLELIGFRVVSCGDGTQALGQARALHPSLITLDLHMPGIDGMEVLKRLGSDEVTAEIPVVVISAYTEDRSFSAYSQVKDIIQKPFDLEELHRKVARVSSRIAA